MKSVLLQNKLSGTRMVFNLSIVLVATLQVGCKKFITTEVPPTQLVATKVFKSSTTATAALLNIYQAMYTNMESYYLEQATGLLSDEFDNYATDNASIQYHSNSMTPDITFGPWTRAYNYIYQANAVVEGVDGNADISTSIQRQLVGEAKFIRAFWHFYLTNCYGDVPIVTSSNYKMNVPLSRASRADVYNQIISDLKDARGLLNDDFVDATDTIATTERVRPTKWAAIAMLARVYLYNGDYSNAEVQATAVIDNKTKFDIVTDLNQVFLVNSMEAIWQLGIPKPNSFNTPEGLYFTLWGTPYAQAISTRLINAFEFGDQRATSWVNFVTTTDVPAVTYYYPYKYKVFYDANITEYTMILRLAEQYLIRAEARAHGTDMGIAISDLNVIRHRAGLGDYGGGTDQSTVLKAVLHERQVELFTEWGHRWFDLVRTNSADTVLGAPGNVCRDKGGVWSPNWKLFPVPQSERNADRNLSQNTGY